jgi:hypothetical protein
MKIIEVKGRCGRVWHVPLEKVREDIACYYKEADKLSLAVAKEKASTLSDDDLETWFREQYIWSEVVRDGVLKKDLSDAAYIKLGKQMADQLRGEAGFHSWEKATSIKLRNIK